MPTVLVVDDHSVVRLGLKQLITELLPRFTVGEAETADQALSQLHKQKWDLAIFDLAMPGRGGLEFLSDIRRRFPLMPVLVLSMYPEDQYALRALKAGAAGYVCKDRPSSELLRAIRIVLSGHKYISVEVTDKFVGISDHDKPKHCELSNREFQIMCALASGQRVIDIGHRLSISAKTVSTHRRRLLNKLGLKTRADLTLYALEHQLLTPHAASAKG